MVVDPGTAMLIASAIQAAAQGGGQYLSSQGATKAGKLRSKEMKRETYANLLNEERNRGAELQAHRMSSRGRTAKRRAQSMQDTSDLVRGALSI